MRDTKVEELSPSNPRCVIMVGDKVLVWGAICGVKDNPMILVEQLSAKKGNKRRSRL
jgi:hypothetical protein